MSSGWPSWVIGRLQKVKGFLRSYEAAAKDRWIATAMTAAAFVPAMGVVGAEYGDLPRRPTDVIAVLLILAQTLPLAVRTRLPAVCLAVSGVAFAADQALAYPTTFGTLSLYLALYSVGAHQDRFRRVLAVAATVAFASFVGVLYLLGSHSDVRDFVVLYVMISLFWVVGVVVRRRRAEEVERRRLTAITATAAERSRIARELHDVVTHHVTAMVVQAEATQFLTSSPERVDEALATIGGTGRQALTELRFLLDVLQATGESEGGTSGSPSLGTMRKLVERTRSGGQPIELIEEGDRPALPVNVGLVVYRVVQEALTNAVKYAAGKPTEVRVGYRNGQIDVEVTTLGPKAVPVVLSVGAATAELPGGRGLAGLRDRVGALGGELTVGEQPEGRFRVHALIPTGGDA